MKINFMGEIYSLLWERKRVKSFKPEGERKLKRNYRNIEETKKQSYYRPEVPRGFQEVKVPRFHENSTGWW